jgi:heme A synthase
MKETTATREATAGLGELTGLLEREGHGREEVAAFIMRCLLTMIIEAMGLTDDVAARLLSLLRSSDDGLRAPRGLALSEEAARRLSALSRRPWLDVEPAIFGTLFLVLLGWLFSRREELPRLFRAALILLGVLVAQMIVGELQYRTHLPWGLVLVHVALAGAVWAGCVAFVTLLWRARRSVPQGAT